MPRSASGSRAEILCISTTPIPWRRGKNDKCRELNRPIRELALRLPRVSYVDGSDVGVDGEGRARIELFWADRLHFNDEGNKLFGDRIRPFLMDTK